ncbi:COG complex component [Rhodotorula sp. JG-1b]|nr:COG complex component [Rhodotorula sp. JG-1b]
MAATEGDAALQDPFSPSTVTTATEPPKPRPESVTAPPLHRPTFTQVLSAADLSAVLSTVGQLPDAPPISHSLLASPDFDASSFLLARRLTPLDQLRSELREYLASLKQSLVGVINDEYEAFIGLSLGLKQAHVSQSLARVRKPVLQVRNEVVRVQDELTAMRDEMSSVLEQRKEARESKALMRRLLATDEAVEKVEALLNLDSPPPPPSSSSMVADSPTKRLERIASEYIHMQYLVNRAGPTLPFIRSLEPRIARITQALRAELSDLLGSVLASRPISASPASSNNITQANSYRQELITTLRTFLSLGMVHEAEEIVRTELVQPFMRRTVTRENLLSPPTTSSSAVPAPYRIERLPLPTQPPPRDGTNLVPLTMLYNRILEFVERECGTVLDVAERVLDSQDDGKNGDAGGGSDDDGSIAGFQVLNNVVVDEIAKAITSELGGVVFAAGRPTVFHQHYRLTTLFLSRLEALSPTLPRLQALRSHSSVTALLKRFQLPVYFQLRLKEAVVLIERAFEMGSASGGGAKDATFASSSSAAAGEDAEEGFVMSESEAVWKALERCWDDDVWLVELGGRFWKLTLQILSRYRTWLNDKVPRYVLPTSASSVNLSAEGDRDRGRLTPNPSTPRPGTPGPSEADTVSEEATLRQLTVLIADARTMERRGRRLYEERIRDKLPRSDAGAAALSAREDVEENTETALSGVTSFVPSLSSQVITILVKRCAEHLKLVRSVASQVRASTRKGPIEPSYFVHNILKELRAYVNGPGRVIEEELRKKWATAVVEDIAGRYTAILSTQKKTEDSLRWLKKGRQGLSFFGRAASSAVGGSGDDAGGGEDDRVKMQMQLDVETLAEDAVALRVEVDASEAFLALKRAARGDVPKEEEGKK